MRGDINSNQYGFAYGKLALSNILQSIEIINEYLMEENYADVT